MYSDAAINDTDESTNTAPTTCNDRFSSSFLLDKASSTIKAITISVALTTAMTIGGAFYKSIEIKKKQNSSALK